MISWFYSLIYYFPLSLFCRALDEGDEAASWFQKVLNKDNARLVRVPPTNARTVPPMVRGKQYENVSLDIPSTVG